MFLKKKLFQSFFFFLDKFSFLGRISGFKGLGNFFPPPLQKNRKILGGLLGQSFFSKIQGRGGNPVSFYFFNLFFLKALMEFYLNKIFNPPWDQKI